MRNQRIQKDIGHAKPLADEVHAISSSFDWRSFNDEEKAQHFSAFLGKLIEGASKAGKTENMTHIVTPLLLAMESDPKFRASMFGMAEDGLGACSDRPPQTLQQMLHRLAQHNLLTKLQEITQSDEKIPPALEQEAIKLALMQFKYNKCVELLNKKGPQHETIEYVLKGLLIIQNTNSSFMACQIPYANHTQCGGVLTIETVEEIQKEVNQAASGKDFISALLDFEPWKVILAQQQFVKNQILEKCEAETTLDKLEAKRSVATDIHSYSEPRSLTNNTQRLDFIKMLESAREHEWKGNISRQIKDLLSIAQSWSENGVVSEKTKGMLNQLQSAISTEILINEEFEKEAVPLREEIKKQKAAQSGELAYTQAAVLRTP